jgi:hypothetical protein
MVNPNPKRSAKLVGKIAKTVNTAVSKGKPNPMGMLDKKFKQSVGLASKSPGISPSPHPMQSLSPRNLRKVLKGVKKASK